MLIVMLQLTLSPDLLRELSLLVALCLTALKRTRSTDLSDKNGTTREMKEKDKRESAKPLIKNDLVTLFKESINFILSA